MTETLLLHYKTDLATLSLRPGRGGVFEVSLDGELLFSKLREDRFPEPAEIIGAIDAQRGRTGR